MSAKHIIRDFCDRLHRQERLQGDPEERLKHPVSELLAELGKHYGLKVDTTREFRIIERSRPDIAVYVNDLVTGVIELKASGRSIDPKRFKDREKRQWESYQNLSNLLYTNGHEWRLYQGDTAPEHRGTATLDPNIIAVGAELLTDRHAEKLASLLGQFLHYSPLVPRTPKELAKVLAPRCRLLRDSVLTAVQVPGSRMAKAGKEWRQLLFTDIDDARFSDAYAQTVTYALLMARLEIKHGPLSVRSAAAQLERSHGLLARALETLTLQREEIQGPLQLLERTIAAVDADALVSKGENPWLYFYEDFLAAYDSRLRNDVGAYYTPVEVVQVQTNLVRELLETQLGKSLGFADAGVMVLDPACGTGTYPYHIINDTLRRLEDRYGAGALAAHASRLGANLAAFEIMVGPYAVAHMRLTQLLLAAGASLPSEGAQVFLSDTLESPASSGQLTLQGMLYERLKAEHERARRIKAQSRVLVCIGNPPYDRQNIDLAENALTSRRGGWVRFGEPQRNKPAILEDFLPPEGSAGIHAKNLYNDYVYFWRWAIWKAFEQFDKEGIVSFITASSYLRGPGFTAMRRHMRKQLEDLWIIDLGGDSLGARKTKNVFAIRTPVCIAVAFRRGPASITKRARVWYTKLADELTREQKLQALNSARSFRDFSWRRAADDWEAPFIPGATGTYATWPKLTELVPWQHSGAQWKRTWPIAETRDLLAERWRALLQSGDRRNDFHETRDRKIDSEVTSLITGGRPPRPLADLRPSAKPPEIVRYAWRSLDRQWCLADSRLGDFLRPVLWQTHSEQQVYFTSLLSEPLSRGPALLACAHIPDLHHFSGRGGADVLPMWRDAEATEPNLAAGLLHALSGKLGQISPQDFFSYLYGCISHPGYTLTLEDELAEPGPRVPITQDRRLFDQVVAVGRDLLNCHTFQSRLSAPGAAPIRGNALCRIGIPQDAYPEIFHFREDRSELCVGEGIFGPVSPAVWQYEVSGLKVLQSWLGYRMLRPRGRSSSPLDALRPRRWTAELTQELMELLWTLERSISLHEKQADLFEQVIQGPVFTTKELPRPLPAQRKPPRSPSEQSLLPFAAKHDEGRSSRVRKRD